MNNNDPLDPSGIAQWLKLHKCGRYLNHRFEPDGEDTARDWHEAFRVLAPGLLGAGKVFEATCVETLATNATRIIGPELGDRSTAAVPDITVTEYWHDTHQQRRDQLHAAIADAASHSPTNPRPYVLAFHPQLLGQVGALAFAGEADLLAIAPAPTDSDAAVEVRVIDIKRASEEHPAHRLQLAMYTSLLADTLDPDTTITVTASVLTTDHRDIDHPLALDTFDPDAWEHVAASLLADSGPVATSLDTPLAEHPYTLNTACDSCGYYEACAVRAIEDPTHPHSLATLGLPEAVLGDLIDAGITSLADLTGVIDRDLTGPDETPRYVVTDPPRYRTLEPILPEPVHDVVRRAQVRRAAMDPDYDDFPFPPLYPSQEGFLPLPADDQPGWSSIDDAQPGQLLHVAMLVRPDPARDRLAALGACVTAGAHDDPQTVVELTEAVPDDPASADTAERDLLDTFLERLFGAIATVADDLDRDATDAVVHAYTFTEHEQHALADALERHDDSRRCRAMRALLSLDPDATTDADQAMVSAVRPILTEHFALAHPTTSLIATLRQFDPDWTLADLDPTPQGEPLYKTFSHRFLDEAAPYSDTDDPGIHVHVGRDHPDGAPAGYYPIRYRAGAQVPIEYLWACTPRNPGDTRPRLHDDIVEEWAIDDDHRDAYEHELDNYRYRTPNRNSRVTQADVTHLFERLTIAFTRLIDAIPYKDNYLTKTPVDTTSLDTFTLGTDTLPAAARDVAAIEYGARRDATLEHYEASIYSRLESGRTVPITVTDVTTTSEGGLRITARLAYHDLLEDPEEAATLASNLRLSGGQSWRVLTRLDGTADDPAYPTGRPRIPHTEVGIDDAHALKHSPPVLVDPSNREDGQVTLSAFPFRFEQHYSTYRQEHCGWTTGDTTNLAEDTTPPAVADRPPVTIAPGETYLLDPMLDDFTVPKVMRALAPDVVEHNALWNHLDRLRRRGITPYSTRFAADGVTEVLDALSATDDALAPNTAQREWIEDVIHPINPLQGPPGAGKTSGAIAPALLARAHAYQHDDAFVGIVTAPSHNAVDHCLANTFACLADLHASELDAPSLDLVRVHPSVPDDPPIRSPPTGRHVVTDYHSDAGRETLVDLTETHLDPQQRLTDTTDGWLLYATPATLYQTLGVIATALPHTEGNTAPAAMHHPKGLADVLAIDEASMLPLGQCLLAGSVLAPDGQALIAGDHRQLAAVSNHDWTTDLRAPIADQQAHRVTIAYLAWLADQPPTNPHPGAIPHQEAAADD